MSIHHDTGNRPENDGASSGRLDYAPGTVEAQQADAVERFVSAYNAIDFHLQGVLGTDIRSAFRNLVDLYAKRHKGWPDAEQLRIYASLRNVLIHDKVEPYLYPCVPTPAAVENIEAIRERLINPRRAIPTFEREVVEVKPADDLRSVLRLIHQLEYSQFPICAAGRFIGLLTETSITRWLAHTTSTAAGLVEFETVTVDDVLARAEQRPNYDFIRPDVAVEDVTALFHENTYLEAVLISEHGTPVAPFLGIATRGDVLRLGP